MDQIIKKLTITKLLNENAEIQLIGQVIPMQRQDIIDTTIIPSAFKECCNISLGPSVVEVLYVSRFVEINKDIFKNYHKMKKELLD